MKIKTQLDKSNSETISLYILVFKTGLSEALLVFFIMIKNIVKGQSLTTDSHIYDMVNTLLEGESFQVFFNTPEKTEERLCETSS